jgi:hypothetical protein
MVLRLFIFHSFKVSDRRKLWCPKWYMQYTLGEARSRLTGMPGANSWSLSAIATRSKVARVVDAMLNGDALVGAAPVHLWGLMFPLQR